MRLPRTHHRKRMPVKHDFFCPSNVVFLHTSILPEQACLTDIKTYLPVGAASIGALRIRWNVLRLILPRSAISHAIREAVPSRFLATQMLAHTRKNTVELNETCVIGRRPLWPLRLPSRAGFICLPAHGPGTPFEGCIR